MCLVLRGRPGHGCVRTDPAFLGADMARYAIDAPTLQHLVGKGVKPSPKHQIVASNAAVCRKPVLIRQTKPIIPADVVPN